MKKIFHYYKIPFKSRVTNIILNLFSILDAIVCITTLGFIGSTFEMDYCVWYTKREIQKRIKEKEAMNGTRNVQEQ